MAAESKLELSSIRAALIRQEDTIIFALIERAQFAHNSCCYEPDAPAYQELVSVSTTTHATSFLDYMLCETERLHARVRRYTSPDEYPFFPGQLPPPELKLLDFPALLHPSCVNLNDRIKALYTQRVLPDLCARGDDEQHGSSVLADVAVLQAISKRVHYGLFVAESKFLGNPEGYRALIEAGDEAGIMELLTNSAVEEKVLRRVHRKASILGGEIETDGTVPGDGTAAGGGAAPKVAGKVDPELILALYRDHIIPLTKVAEVEYLMQRLGPPLVACAGEAGGGSHQAAARAFSTPGKEPPSLLASGTVPAVFAAVMSNKCAYGVVPLEQGERGVLAATRRLLWSSPGVVVTGEVVREESYRVVSRVPLQQVRRVCGRAQAMEHSKSWLQNVLPASTEYVRLEEEEGAPPWEGRQGEPDAATAFLCGEGEAAPPTLCESTPVRGGARDRFTYLVLAKRAEVAGPPSGADKSMALFSLDDEAGGLATALAAFHRHAVNLTFIQSYSDCDEQRRIYVFLVQLNGHVTETHVASALDELRACVSHVRVLGSFVPTKN